MQTITQKVNRYRINTTHFVSFPFDCTGLNVFGYVKNNGVSKMKGIDVFNFDTISYLSTSENGFIHAVGVLNKQLYQLILKK